MTLLEDAAVAAGIEAAEALSPEGTATAAAAAVANIAHKVAVGLGTTLEPEERRAVGTTTSRLPTGPKASAKEVAGRDFSADAAPKQQQQQQQQKRQRTPSTSPPPRSPRVSTSLPPVQGCGRSGDDEKKPKRAQKETRVSSDSADAAVLERSSMRPPPPASAVPVSSGGGTGDTG